MRGQRRRPGVEHVGTGGRAGGVRIAGADRGDQRVVLGPGVTGAFGRGPPVHPLEPGVQRRHHRVQHGVARVRADGRVERGVQFGEPVELLRLGRLPGVPEDAVELVGRGGAGPLGGQPGGEHLEREADVEQILDVLNGKLRDDRAAPRLRHQPTFRLQHADRLADRVAGDPERVGEPVLGEPVARCVHPVDDPAAQLRSDLVTQWTMGVTDSGGHLHTVSNQMAIHVASDRASGAPSAA